MLLLLKIVRLKELALRCLLISYLADNKSALMVNFKSVLKTDVLEAAGASDFIDRCQLCIALICHAFLYLLFLLLLRDTPPTFGVLIPRLIWVLLILDLYPHGTNWAYDHVNTVEVTW